MGKVSFSIGDIVYLEKFCRLIKDYNICNKNNNFRWEQIYEGYYDLDDPRTYFITDEIIVFEIYEKEDCFICKQTFRGEEGFLRFNKETFELIHV